MNRCALVAASALCLGALAVPASAASPARPFDYDGNGSPDLTVGAPGLRVGSLRDAGGVVVLPASRAGISLRERVITQSTPGVPGGSEAADRFGAALASADFDRDGYADLAVGQPGEAVGTALGAGAVTVVYGSATGLDPSRSQGLTSVAGPTQYAGFGTALVAADLTRDGYPDLAIGAPLDDLDQSQDADFHPSGTVTVLPGGPAGLGTAGSRVLRRTPLPDFDVRFGGLLAAGDIDGDGGADLVVGSPGQRVVDEGYPGSIGYCPGSVGGPTACTRLVKSSRYAGMTSLAVGNMSGAANPEIVAGSPSAVEDDPGRVVILQLEAGTPMRLTRQLSLSQDNTGVPGHSEHEDSFGRSVTTGDIDRDGYADLVIGAPGEDAGAGRVTVVHGSRTGWRPSGNAAYGQDTAGVPGAAEPNDGFGRTASLQDHDRDGRLDLTVGSPGENADAGAVTTLRGAGSGFTTQGARTFGLAGLGRNGARALFSASLGG